MLTPRQTDVIGLLARGLTTQQTAALLGMSEQTVRWHSKHARRRLDARNTAHAVAICLYRGLIVP